MATSKSILFNLEKIETLQFATVKNAHKEDSEVVLLYNVGLQANTKHHAVTFLFEVQFLCEDKPFIILAVQCEFEIEEASYKNLIKESNQIVVPKGLALHLGVICTGTARGILHEKLRKTPFSNYILPTVDLTQIIKEDAQLVEEQEKADNALV